MLSKKERDVPLFPPCDRQHGLELEPGAEEHKTRGLASAMVALLQTVVMCVVVSWSSLGHRPGPHSARHCTYTEQKEALCLMVLSWL